MLTLTIKLKESFDDEKEEFVEETLTIDLEHSLVSLSKWESIWEKPFLTSVEKTTEETNSYVECMILTKNVPEDIFSYFDNEHYTAVTDYINAKMTATWFGERSRKPPSREVITAELIYYWMIALQVPFECQNWHLNRLLTLIEICTIKNAPQKKGNRREIIERQRALNAERKAKLQTSG